MKRIVLVSASLLAGLASAARAQGGASIEKTLTNRDIVVLAQAGFTENFLVDLIALSRTRFDTSVAGLAELAKSGVSEQLIRVMLAAPASLQAGFAPAAASPVATVAPPMEAKRLKRSANPNESTLAISSQAPYYRTSSFLWGLWTKKTGVGVGRHTTEQPIGAQLGAAFSQPGGNPGMHYVVAP